MISQGPFARKPELSCGEAPDVSAALKQLCGGNKRLINEKQQKKKFLIIWPFFSFLLLELEQAETRAQKPRLNSGRNY